MLEIGQEQLELLERLTNACAVSGDEGAVRKIVLDEVEEYVDELQVDALGNVLALCRGEGDGERLKVMVAAHMDEVGFMLTADEKKGLYRFARVGGLDPRQLVGKALWVGAERIPGVIGAKPIHFTKKKERQNAISLESLRIDVGPENGSKIKVGDRATFATQFTRLGKSIRAKALDDRFGVATLIELVKHAPQNIDLLTAFTVQEEVGLRGAWVAAYALDPDLGFALDSTPARDFLPWNDEEENVTYNTRLGAGPAIYTTDARTISDPRLIKHLITTAEELDLPYQLRQPGGGGTDAGAIHRQRAGVPSVTVSVPARYLHSAASLARMADWEATLALVHAALGRLGAGIMQFAD
ncbi:MAG: putative aminopeptidase YsdC [Chloroflexi bacterium]|nr:putative aminopeptidase YsdC [Chloroflexota bacterium]